MPELSSADEILSQEYYSPLHKLLGITPVLVKQSNEYDRKVFVERPLLGPLLFDNESSDARDHCANERTFLSWLRLSTFMAVVALAIIMSFHLKRQPTEMEKDISLPFGLVFWLLALACLASGLSNYMRTVTNYSKRRALVQSGWKTQTVSTIVAVAIISACVILLTTGAEAGNS